MVDISTGNVIITGVFAAATGMLLFVLGLITSYVKSIKNDMKELLKMAVEHNVKIDAHEEQLKDIYEKIYKLNRAT